MEIRPERPGDERAIAQVITNAFLTAEHSDGTEAAIVERLRVDGALSMSLVAERDGAIVGHVAMSPVTIDGADHGWFGLGPVAVCPGAQRQGIGRALIEGAMAALADRDAAGVVVLGDPDYYGRFGFAADPRLSYPGLPARFFQALCLRGEIPRGTVTYAPAFSG